MPRQLNQSRPVLGGGKITAQWTSYVAYNADLQEVEVWSGYDGKLYEAITINRQPMFKRLVGWPVCA